MANCATATLYGIKTNCDTSKGGIKAIWISNYSKNNATITNESEDKKSINITSTSGWLYFYTKKNTTSFTSTLTVDPANGVNYVTTVLSVVFNRMDIEKQRSMAALSVNDLNIVVQDSNDNFWYLGIDNPVYATSATGETGTAKTDGNKYTIEFTDDSNTYPMVLNTTSANLMKSIAKQ